MRSKVIKQTGFFGLYIYRKIRVSNTKILIGNYYDKEFMVGLYPLVKYPKLEYDYISLYQQKDWNKTVDELFYKAFMYLIFVNAIRIYSFKDNEILFGVFKKEVNGFYIELNDFSTTGDIFLNLLLKSINESNNNLENIVSNSINALLGSSNNEYNRPEKKFLTRLIKRYTIRYSWIELEKENSFLGLISKYKVKIEENKLLSLKEDFRSLSALSLKEKPNNIDLVNFERELSKIVRSDFRNRYPNNDDFD